MEPGRARAAEGLHRLGQVLRSHDCFNTEDEDFLHAELSRMNKVDEELRMLEEMLARRQQHLRTIDEQYGLSQYHPDMMRKFAEKDFELHQIKMAKLAAIEAAQ